MDQIKKLYFIDDSDDEFFMSSLVFEMQKIQLEIVHFPDFESFFERLNSGEIANPASHLFLIDMNLTVMKGTEGVRLIRAEDKWERLIVGICSGSADPADVKNAMEAGANVFAPKPLDRSCLQFICDHIEELHLNERPDGAVELFRNQSTPAPLALQ